MGKNNGSILVKLSVRREREQGKEREREREREHAAALLDMSAPTS